ncbi:MAG: TIGR02452 family protein, partial [Clostridiales bacterium]|nr:TIGR02452 family protein [Clostridiales bacterium]
TNLGTNAVIITPRVEIIRDDDNNLLEESVVVAVMTCAAPNIRDGIADMTQQQYEEMVYSRIMRMLLVAASRGYNNLVLGAWGCGAFGNDPKMMSDLFKKAARETDGLFETMEFAIVRNDEKPENYNEFSRNFKS